MSDQLEKARRVLTGYEPEQAPGAKQRARRALERAMERRPWYEPSWAQVAPVLVAIAAFTIIVRWPTAQTPDLEAPSIVVEAPAPRPRVVTGEQPVEVGIGGGVAKAAARTIFEVPELEADRALIRLTEGELEIGLLASAARPTLVDTAEARVSAIGARFVVRAGAAGTSVEVLAGSVEIATHAGGGRRVLGPGARVRVVKRAATVATPEVVMPAPAVARAAQKAPANGVPAPNVPDAPVAPEPAAVFETPPIEPGSPKAQTIALAEARALLPKDAPRAAEMAEQVLGVRPSPAIEAEALALLADAERRKGERRKASDLYARLAGHAKGRPYAEEAWYQRARIEAELGDRALAFAALEEAARAFPDGPLAPERAALEADLRLAAGDVQRAARALETAPASVRSILLSRSRLKVARALLPSDPARARSLIAPLIGDNGLPEALRREAADVATSADSRRGGSPK